MKKRCTWVNPDNQLDMDYHDKEWGVPVFDDRLLFEMLTLEGAQAGLSWAMILKKRQHYKQAFDDFDVQKIAKYDDKKVAELLENAGIVRNKLKIQSTLKNAKAFLAIQQEFGSFSAYIWGFVGGKPIDNHFAVPSDIPAKTVLSDTIAKDLKKRGMSFVGSTIIYAFMQAIGMVNEKVSNSYPLCIWT